MKRFLFRAIVSMFLVYGINQFLNSQDVAIRVGLNICTFFTTGFLGLPGIALLYGIVFFQFL